MKKCDGKKGGVCPEKEEEDEDWRYWRKVAEENKKIRSNRFVCDSILKTWTLRSKECTELTLYLSPIVAHSRIHSEYAAKMQREFKNGVPSQWQIGHNKTTTLVATAN